ncbi:MULTISPECIES: ABC transporter ATP-binding protein [Bradyrhizobium]|uniref:Glutathione import ATP-binding protein GsiA n=1 Tax=Bradyrhizobium yuanmingense TaxID=108015 RepID=A0A1C3U9M0_9BRAD|nr:MULTISPECIES: ABC transporter ATP-binding protein [Bradyrhizobium]MCA1470546.1 ABC transporter ATP-binding protein [Bradyrhizobium sp. IC3195]MCA1505358.1 ABC transporter ATP-binding protein [Bradyrhizobium sp. NBAIM02]MCA1531244.1 ABC transporter ATP-binding protein [Bradyrhizobium sp. NBAIM03]TWI30067.1 peptide/nickel transport system ATP-binding protein [Bradyrhizobium yuanmingense]UWU86341.1 ABC transporter ATP-binding protein [Bradyrhizobium sp. CB1024]
MSIDRRRSDQAVAEAQSSVLSVSGLTTSFMLERQWIPVVRKVSFDIAARETVAIVGESGSGKSVTALSIMRLIPSEIGRVEGRVMLAGRDLLALPEADMKDIRGNDVAMIFQEPMTSLNPVLTIGFQIAEALIQHRGLSRAAAEAETVRLLDRVRIPAAASRFHEHPHRFSGGMRQRVMIAMALACKPKLLIADEPTTALDVTIQAQILELLKELQQEEGMSILFITHDMGVVAEIADRTVVMYGGQAVETDATARIFAAPADPYTRALLAAVPRLGSMDGRMRPMRFPIVDKVTGTSDEPAETPDTVSPAERPLLEVSNLTTRFPIRSGLFGKVSGRVHAVENVSFTLRAGETLALVGESGCGKSTTGRSILKLTQPDSGTVLIDGQDVLAMNGRALRDVRKHMQIVFQDPFASLNPRMSVGTAIAAPLLANGLATASQARDKVADLLVRVGLSADMAARFPHEFSGGQRQRICIARALALGPKLIVADEAVSALDVSVKAQVVNLMLDLQASMGLAYLFISHDIAVVERMSHRVAVMFLGEIVEIGPRASVFGNPQHPYTKKLMAAVPVPDPSRRGTPRPTSNDEIRSPVRAPDYQPPVRRYREVSPGHVVQMWGEEWSA